MRHSEDEIWQFLRVNGVKKVRIFNDEFEFLTVSSERISPNIFILQLLQKLRGTPKRLDIKKVSRPNRGNRWESIFHIDTLYSGNDLRRIGLRQPYRNKQVHPEIDALKVWQKDLEEMYNKAVFGDLIIPDDLTAHATDHVHEGQTKTKRVNANLTVYLEKYVYTLKVLKIPNPEYDDLQRVTGVSSTTWSRRLNNREFLVMLMAEFKRLQKYRYSKSKETKSFWQRAEATISERGKRLISREDAMADGRFVQLDERRTTSQNETNSDSDESSPDNYS